MTIESNAADGDAAAGGGATVCADDGRARERHAAVTIGRR
jgi:hypothetical protein